LATGFVKASPVKGCFLIAFTGLYTSIMRPVVPTISSKINTAKNKAEIDYTTFKDLS